MYDNLITSDHLEQVVRKIQDTKASKSTTLSGYGITDSYTKTETDSRIQDIVGAAPEALDTLEEIAEALQDGESTTAGLVQTLSQKADKSTTVTNIAYGSKKLTKTINGSTTDIVTINAIKSDLALTKSDVGLSNVDNTSDVNKPVSNATQTALDTKVDKVSGKGLSTNDYTTTEKNKLSGIASNAQVNIIESIKVNNTALPISSKAVNITVPTKTSELTNNSNFAVDSNYVHTDNNYTTAEKQKLASKVAELDDNGKVLSSQLPSYVDNVVEYASSANFPTTGESGKIYVDTGANLTYRWTGSTYTEISPSLALGETSSTAYRGDRGKVAYTHATDSNRLTTAKTSGLYKISTTAEGHVASAETATKSDIGLGNVDNTSDLDKPISTATQEALNTKVNATTSVLKSDEEFTYRQTGGSLDIDAKYGKLKSIKGRTLVWNQRVAPDAEYVGTLTTKDTSVTTENKYVETTTTSSSGRSLSFNSGADIAPGHKALVIWIIKSDYASAPFLRYTKTTNVYGNINISNYVADAWNVVYSIIDEGLMFRGNTGIIPSDANHIQGKYLSTPLSGGLKVFDLTLMFGAGNEPTIEEFKALFPEYDYTYNEGELVNNGRQTEYDLLWNQNEDLPSNLRVTDGSGLTATWDNAQQAIKVVIPSGTRSSNVSVAWGATTTTYRTSGHKYLYLFRVSDNIKPSMGYGSCWWQNTITSSVSSDIITKDTAGLQIQHAIYFGTSIAAGTYYFCPMSFDLTAMFGAGNEPSTPGEFRDMFPNLYYAYDTGTQQHFSFPQFKTKIETVGWNIWDEEMENYSYNQTTGKKQQSGAAVRSKNKFSVIPGTSLYLNLFGSTTVIRFFKYAADGSYLGTETSYGNQTYTVPSGVYLIAFQVSDVVYQLPYKNDICISLSDPSRNGTYEPYWRSELELGLGDIKVKSHNLWDEEWESGSINDTSGDNEASTTTFRSKHYIPVIPSGVYYIKRSVFSDSARVRVFQYDKNYTYLGSPSNVNNTTITLGSSVYFIRFRSVNSGTTYNNDICINLSDPAYNGRYEPYGDGGVISITGGLKSAGTVYDEISGGKFIKRIESVDMGSLTWGYLDSYAAFYADIAGMPSVYTTNMLCVKYTAKGVIYTTLEDKEMSNRSGYNRLYVKDSAYTDAATFKSGNSGTMLYYELAQPIEYELYNPIDLSYKVDKFGTEKLLPESTSAIVSSPFRADIEYRTTNVTIDDVYGGSDIIKNVEDVDSRLTTVEKSINGLVTIGSGSPTTIPKNIGDFYIDVTNKVLYFATGNQLISDWNS